MRNVPLSGIEAKKLLIRIVLIFEKRNSKKMSYTIRRMYFIQSNIYLDRKQDILAAYK